jgi:hypothetical protein
MDTIDSTSFPIDYHRIVDRFVSEKLRPRLNSGGYSPETVRVLRALEWELLGLIDAQREINRKAKGEYVDKRRQSDSTRYEGPSL